MRILDSDVFSSSNRGKVRKQNEDSCGVFEVPNGKLYIVCDGMGGHAGGATASKIGVDSIANYFQQTKYPDIRLALADALEYANLQILDAAAEMPSLKGMGTTACVLLIQGDEAWIAHCGDSRIYLYCAEQQWLHRITRDHSYVQGLVDQGLITDAEAENHPNKNRILKALGIKPGCKPTVCGQPVLPADGDTFLICSDGLSGMVNDEQLQYVLTQDASIASKGQMMIQLALQAGGLDNITAQLVRVSDSPHPHSVFISQNPKERLVAKPVPQSGKRTGGKKSQKLLLKIMMPVVAALLIVCGVLWMIPSRSPQDQVSEPAPSSSSNRDTEIFQNNSIQGNGIQGDNIAREDAQNRPSEIENPPSANPSDNLEKGSYVLVYKEIDPLTHKETEFTRQGNYEHEIKLDRFCTDGKKNYKYRQSKGGRTINEGEKPNVTALYKTIVGGGPAKITIEKPEIAIPSKQQVKVEKYSCDLYGNLKDVIEERNIQWYNEFYINDKLVETPGYYDSEAEVKSKAQEWLKSAPDSVPCKVLWFNYAKEISGSMDNKSKYDEYKKQQSENNKPDTPPANPNGGKEGAASDTMEKTVPDTTQNKTVTNKNVKNTGKKPKSGRKR
ncbi:MAG: Stp1/IreP family PP2C-type Ser/Thr phosphatase [Paludibacteraceae bacterium]|nr:Stp1/IreP family PP2C-type Ser/Thr phosphatase [Paludibacteraceae bacterium]